MTTGILRKDFQTGYFAKKQMVQNGAGGEPLSGLGENCEQSKWITSGIHGCISISKGQDCALSLKPYVRN